jgi:hypothetical protein
LPTVTSAVDAAIGATHDETVESALSTTDTAAYTTAF